MMTKAQKVANDFNSATKTISISVLAKREGAIKEVTWTEIIYKFDDDSRLITKGRGRAHKITVETPF